MLRQRLRFRSSPLAYLGRVLLAVLGAALVWYGLMLLLLALKVDPETVNDLSGRPRYLVDHTRYEPLREVI